MKGRTVADMFFQALRDALLCIDDQGKILDKEWVEVIHPIPNLEQFLLLVGETQEELLANRKSKPYTGELINRYREWIKLYAFEFTLDDETLNFLVAVGCLGLLNAIETCVQCNDPNTYFGRKVRDEMVKVVSERRPKNKSVGHDHLLKEPKEVRLMFGDIDLRKVRQEADKYLPKDDPDEESGLLLRP